MQADALIWFQQVFEIRGKFKIHNVTTFCLAQLERLDNFTSVNMHRKSLFNPKHDLREKWLDATFKVHETSARKVLTGSKILSTIFLLAASLLSVWAFLVFHLPKMLTQYLCFERSEFLDVFHMTGQTGNTNVWYIEIFFNKNCNMVAIYCALLSHSQNLLSLNQASLNTFIYRHTLNQAYTYF